MPSAIFQPGPKSFEKVAAYRQAVGDPEALQTLQDYAASSLKTAAGRPDGTLDPSKAASWLARHSDAMRAFPDLQAKFQNAAAASDVIGEVAARRKAALEEYQTGVLGKITGLSAPSEVSRVIGGILSSPTGVSQMRQLAAAAASNPQAMTGLRKSVAEYMRQRLVSTAESGATGEGAIRANAIQAFVKQNTPALRTVFSDEQISSTKAIADDLQRSGRSQALGRHIDAAERPSILRKIVTEGAGMMGGAAMSHTPVIGPMIGWLGVKAVNAIRDAGITRTDELVREAMLHPEVARALLAKVPPRPAASFGNSLATALARSSLLGAAVRPVVASVPLPAQPPAQGLSTQAGYP